MKLQVKKTTHSKSTEQWLVRNTEKVNACRLAADYTV